MDVSAEWRAVEKGECITGKEAYKDYRLNSKIRDPKKFDYYTDYKRITRKIWKRVAQDSVEYEGGVYAKGFFYIVPEVIANIAFATNRFNKNYVDPMRSTGGDMYTILFVNLFREFKYNFWSMDGLFTQNYKKRASKLFRKIRPKYKFLLDTLLNPNK
jgi:hypothetical protein